MRLPRISSVAFKLAGATLALVALVTTGVSIQLERSQREGLLRAEELSASAVTRLFADSCAPAVIFDDPGDLYATLVTLGRNEDVEYVAVWGGRRQRAHHAPQVRARAVERWAAFWSAFAHVARNTVDHGVETSEKRIADGKSERATIHIAIGRDRDRILISMQDDGPGVDWQAIARRARARGLPAETHAQLMAALFTDGISSRATATSTLGRGVGLGAVRAAIDSLGGELELSSAGAAGTLFRCWLPLTEADADPLDREVTGKLEVRLAAAGGARTTPVT